VNDTSETTDGVLSRIQAAVGPKGWISDSDDMAPYLTDQRGRYHGRCDAVVRPANREEVAEVVRLAAEARIPIVPQGGNTGLVGASVPFEEGGGIVLSLARMNRIREIDPLNDTMTAEAGCVLADLQAAARDVDRLFPLSLAAEGSCMIGGNLSTNAGGVAVLKFGSTRNLALGLEVVLPDGTLWDGLRGLRKDNTGYDLKQLFIGAEGTLGVITAAVLKLFPRPRDVQTAFIAVPELEDVTRLLADAKAATGDTVTAFELIPGIVLEATLKHFPEAREPLKTRTPWYVLMELSSGLTGGAGRQCLEDFLAGGYDSGLIADAVIATSGTQAKQIWYLRDILPETEVREGASIKHDVSVPISRVTKFIARATAMMEKEMAGIRVLAFGHVGDGNIHFNLSQPEGMEETAFLDHRERLHRMIHDLVAELGGSISAEHGIGRLKRDELVRYRSRIELDLMRAIKKTLDPDNIMNPGKVI
jgi:FAD/FMN-containing dehydrogenase